MRTMRHRVIGVLVVSMVAACSAPGVTPSIRPSVVASAPTNSPTPTAMPSADPGLPVFEDSEPLLLVARLTGAGGGIFVLRPDGTGATRLATDALPGVHKHPDWSPDGRRVVFIDDRTEQMWIAHLDGSPTTSVAACDAPGCDYPAWSPDGSKIAFSRYEAGDFVGPAALAILVLDVASGEVDEVVRLERPLLVDAPRWSPDGASLVVQVDRMDDAGNETGAAIAVVPASGGELRYLTDFETFASFPDWGWATDEIVFTESLRGEQLEPTPADASWNVFGIQPDGSGFRQVTEMPPGQRLVAVRWAPGENLLVAKQFDDIAGGGRTVDPTTGRVEPFVTDAQYSVPVPRPMD